VPVSLPPSVALPRGVRAGCLRPRAAPPPGEFATLDASPGPGGRARVVLVPGFTGSKEDFLPLLPLLAAAGHPATAIDLPGQFESPGPEEPAGYTIESLAAGVRAVVDHVADGTGVHLVGHSFGGLVARQVVLDDPRGVLSLTLLGSGPGAIGGGRAAGIEMLPGLLAERGVDGLWEIVEAGDPRRANLPPDIRDFLRRRHFGTNPVGLVAMGDQLLTAPDRVADLSAIGLAIFVLHGEGDDAWPPDVQAAMADRLGARYAVVPGAMHSPACEAPEPTGRLLIDFWAASGR